ncbi:hypothetical protein [Streptomyces litmocidini]|uniref:hypothetical protein n=1 Tax=Streptomyces litmocidini TaxID=67318 RepID=UPI001E4246A4|nr:hypothetical protein [Streptomyces litmocidini]
MHRFTGVPGRPTPSASPRARARDTDTGAVTAIVGVGTALAVTPDLPERRAARPSAPCGR